LNQLNSNALVDLLVVYDGRPSKEKAATTQIRIERKRKAILKFEEKVIEIKEGRNRVSKALHKSVQKLYMAVKNVEAYTVPTGVISTTARGEADVYMGGLRKNVVRISCDSDNLFYPECDIVARPYREGS
jgi:uncharacterized protein involved in tolerance to divalent cations